MWGRGEDRDMNTDGYTALGSDLGETEGCGAEVKIET